MSAPLDTMSPNRRKGIDMTVIINPRYARKAEVQKQSTLVTPAAVWDCGDGQSAMGVIEGERRQMRTLGAGSRTLNYRIVPDSRSTSNGDYGKRYSRDSNKGSSFLLGAVFGLAVFIGTLTTGLGEEESSYAPYGAGVEASHLSSTR